MKKTIFSAVAASLLCGSAMAQTYHVPQVKEGETSELVRTADLIKKVLVSTEEMVDNEGIPTGQTRYNYQYVFTDEAKEWCDYTLKHEAGDVDIEGNSMEGEAYIQATNRWVQINPLLGDDYLPLESPWSLKSSDPDYGCMPWYGTGNETSYASDGSVYSEGVDLNKDFHMVCSGKNSDGGDVKHVKFYVTGADKITVYFNGSASDITYAYVAINGGDPKRSGKKLSKTTSPQSDLMTLELDRTKNNVIEFYGSHRDVMLYAFRLYGDPNISTAINDVERATADNAIYNLAGQRVNNAVKGIYIVNGKKVMK